MADRPLPAYVGDEPYVFVSYSHEDDDLVHPEIRWLQDNGFNVWWDEGISPGASWRAELADALRGCSLIIYFVTPNSAASDQCTREINYGLDQFHRPVLAVHLVETELPHALGLVLSDRQAILRHVIDQSDYQRKLLSAVATYLDAPLDLEALPTTRRRGRWRSIIRLRHVMLAAAIGVLAGLAVGAFLPRQLSDADDVPKRRQVQFEIALPEGVYLPRDHHSYLTIAPDGDEVYFIGEQEDGQRQVYARNVEGLEVTPLANTKWVRPREVGAAHVARTGGLATVQSSPDGKSLLLGYANGVVRLAPLQGGSPFQLTQGQAGNHRAHWGRNGEIAFRINETAIAIFADGSVRTVFSEDQAEVLTHPQLTPDGQGILYCRWSRDNERQILHRSLDADDTRLVLDAACDPRITSGGHLLFVRNRQVWAANLAPSFDATEGEPEPVLQGVRISAPGSLGAHFAVAEDGTLVFHPLFEEDLIQFIHVGRTGTEQLVGLAPQSGVQAVISPDETKIAFTTLGGGSTGVWTYAFADQLLTRVVDLGSADLAIAPAWSPDGRRIAFSYSEVGYASSQIMIADLERPGSLEQVPMPTERVKGPSYWIPDTNTLLYHECEPGGRACDIVAVDVSAPFNSRKILNTSANERQAVVSPNGRYMAYASDEFGVDRVVIRTYPDLDGAYWQVPIDNCSEPKWSPTGDELFAWCEKNGLTAIPVETEIEFTLGQPNFLFDTSDYSVRPNQAYGVYGDGERFLLFKSIPPVRQNLVVITNWLDEVERLLPMNR